MRNGRLFFDVLRARLICDFIEGNVECISEASVHHSVPSFVCSNTYGRLMASEVLFYTSFFFFFFNGSFTMEMEKAFLEPVLLFSPCESYQVACLLMPSCGFWLWIFSQVPVWKRETATHVRAKCFSLSDPIAKTARRAAEPQRWLSASWPSGITPDWSSLASH